jgi:hypothetical protein
MPARKCMFAQLRRCDEKQTRREQHRRDEFRVARPARERRRRRADARNARSGRDVCLVPRSRRYARPRASTTDGSNCGGAPDRVEARSRARPEAVAGNCVRLATAASRASQSRRETTTAPHPARWTRDIDAPRAAPRSRLHSRASGSGDERIESPRWILVRRVGAVAAARRCKALAYREAAVVSTANPRCRCNASLEYRSGRRPSR